MSLISSRTPHPSQLDPSPFAAPSPQLAPFASRTSRHAYSLLPAPSIVQPAPLPPPDPSSLSLVAQVCSSNGAGLYGGWRRLDFIIQTGANRKRISPKRGAGMYNIFKLVPTARGTCTTYRGHLYRSLDRPAPYIWDPGAIITHTVHLIDLRHTSGRPAPGAWPPSQNVDRRDCFCRYFDTPVPLLGTGATVFGALVYVQMFCSPYFNLDIPGKCCTFDYIRQ